MVKVSPSKTFGATSRQWKDWRWQMRARLKTPQDFVQYFDLSETEQKAITHAADRLPMGLTPYYAALMSRTDAEHPLRRAHLPREDEFVIGE